MSKETINFILGLIGTVTGVGSLILEFYKELISSYRIKVKIQKDMRGINSEPYMRKGVDYIVFTVTNAGKRPIKINQVFLHFFNDEMNYILTDSILPGIDRILTIENPSTQYNLEQEGVKLENLIFVGVVDAYGKTHKYFPHKKFLTPIWLLFKNTQKFFKKEPILQ